MCLFIGASFLDFTKGQTELKKVTLCFLVVISIFFVGLRYYTGADWSGHLNYFNTVTWQDNRYAIGYKALNLLCRAIVDDYHLVQFVASSFFIISVARFFYKYSKYPFLCLFILVALYFRNLFMALVRQDLAVAVLLWGSGYIFKRRFWSWCMIVLIASSFHVTAIVCLLFPLLNIHLTRKMRFLFCLVPFIIYFLPDLLFSFVELMTKIPGTLGVLTMRYLSSERFSKGVELSSGIVFFSKMIFSILILLLSKDIVKKKDDSTNFFLNGLLISVILNSLTLVFRILSRLEIYVCCYAIIGFVHFFRIGIIKKEKSFFFPILFLFILYFTLPFAKNMLVSKIDPVTLRDVQYQYIPYYNVFIHPENANQRKDWNQ